MIEWGTIASLLCLVLLIFLLWKEWTRSNRAFLTARLAATIIAVLCLYLLANPPSYTRKVEQADNQLIILTDGYEQDSVRALSGFEKMPLYDLREEQSKANGNPGMDEMFMRHPGVHIMHVFGYGLRGHQLEQLKAHSVIFHPSRPPAGFSRLQYKKELEQGEWLQIQGSFIHRDSGRVNIFLSHFGMKLDSAWMVDGVFQLKAIPPQVGRATYSLIAMKGKDTLEKQILPVVVNERKIFRVLMIGSAPGFESRFLKDWLVRKGYQVVSRTRVSKNVYSKEFVNEDRVAIERITDAVLRATDLVLADQAALASLSAFELAVIRQSIVANGMGMMYWADDEGQDVFGRRISKMPGGEQQKLNLLLSDSTGLKTLGTENQFYIPAMSSARALVRARDGKIYASVSQEGKGRVVLSTVNYSYKWILSGNNAEYDRYWTSLLSHTLGRSAAEKWVIAPELGFVHEPFKLAVETPASQPAVVIDEQQIALENDPVDPTRWRGSYWPGRAGWHALGKSDDNPAWFYVFNQGAWRPLMMSTRIRENMEFVLSLKVKPSVLIKQESEENKQVPLIIYGLLFMIAAGFLWFENKRMDG